MPGAEYPGSTYPAQYASLGIPLAPSWLPILPVQQRRARGSTLLAPATTPLFPVSLPFGLSWLPILPLLPPARQTRAIWHWLAVTRAIVFPLPLPLPCPTPTPPPASADNESCTVVVLGGGN